MRNTVYTDTEPRTKRGPKVLRPFEQQRSNEPEAEAGDAGKSVVFHEVHGENVQLDKEKKVARRVKSYCKSVVFSSRPIEPGEVVLLHLTECCEDWSGSIRVGFTTHNPVSLKASLPTSAYPNLMNVPGNWVKPVDDDHAKQDAYIHFYVTEAGEVLYGSNGKDETELLTGIDTSGPLWALIDVYGRTLAIEIFDEGAINSSSDEVKETPLTTDLSSTLRPDSLPWPLCRRGDPCTRPICTGNNKACTDLAGDDKWTHLAYHKILGPNTRLDPGDSQVAERCELGKRKAFAFLSRPLATNELLQVKVEGWEEALPGSLSFGMTTCDPSSLSGKTGELPDNLDNLLDREEYWVFQKALNCALNDQLVFVTRDDGQVEYSRNGGPFSTILHVDGAENLFAFFDIAGRVTRLRLRMRTMPLCFIRLFKAVNTLMNLAYRIAC
ncbi:hypothetical protein HPB48_018091 [Haemaphysalis longicornis]|uniref:NHR domain-containing protein n=1 Tax=Haemaphysalis longicornis TaxID=44386 RepID=A0A9J6FJS7_HAELO|nr:hypothetical protein HPB48_018091 [Haemaphysalis longicornis]